VAVVRDDLDQFVEQRRSFPALVRAPEYQAVPLLRRPRQVVVERIEVPVPVTATPVDESLVERGIVTILWNV
jgi:hypothetical protein